MPFSKVLENTFYALQQAAKGVGAEVERADDPPLTETIIQRIYRGIGDATLVLADLTDRNANVFYEVGYAHALGKPVALLAPSIDVVPFDLRVYPIKTYSAGASVAELVSLFVPFLHSALDAAEDTSSLRGPIENALRQLSGSSWPSPLFRSVVAKKLDEFDHEVSNWVRGSMNVGPEETREKGIAILQNLRHEGFATMLVPVESFWATGTDYLLASRRAAQQRGARITRVFIVFDETTIESKSLAECIEQDERAGIATYICLANRVRDREAIKDFGIWDSEVLCWVEVTSLDRSPTVTGTLFTTEPTQLTRAARWKENLLEAAEPARLVLARFNREERAQQPLAASARHMAALSKKACGGSYVDKRDCDWYHGSWQYLRLVDVVSTPDWHSSFTLRRSHG